MIRIPIFLMLPFLAVACAIPREPAVKKVSPVGSHSPRRHAIVIGVNEYPVLGEGWNLAGAAGDARSMGEVLASRFEFDSVRTLIAAKDRTGDEQLATAQATRSAMQEVLQEVGKGDIVLFFFSGHGVLVEDQPPGVEGHDESDTHFDSALVLRDSSKTDRVLRDDEIHTWSQALLEKDAFLLTVFDACHSGTAFRSSGLRPRGLPRPKNFARSSSAKPGFASLPDGVVSMSACLDEEQAFETEAPAAGVFTTHLLAALRSTRPGTTYEALYDRVLARVRAWQAACAISDRMQTPVLRGGRRADGRRKLLFSSGAVHGSSIPVVIGRRQKGATLSVGIVQGVAVGSKFLVYDASVTADQILTRNAPRAVGVLEIEIVAPTSCRGRWIMTPPKSAEPSLAVCIDAPLPEARMTIRLDASLPGPVADGLATLIQEAGPPLDRLVLARGEADAGRGEVKEMASFGRGDQGFTLTVSGQIPLAVSGEEPRDLLRVLRKLMDHRALTSLRAPEPNLLAGKVELMVRVDPQRRERSLTVQEFEELDPALPRGSNGEIVFTGAESGEGRTIYSVAVKNHGVLSLYGHLFNLTPDLKISLLADQVTLQSGATTVIGQFVVDAEPGIECMKLIASTEAIENIGSLAQGGVTRGGPMGSLMRQMRHRMGRPTMRSGAAPDDVTWSGSTPDDGLWITSEAFWRVKVR